MSTFKHTYMVLATDFELEPVIEQYLTTYPAQQPRKYDVACRLQNERQEGDYCYIVVYEFVGGRKSVPTLEEYIKAYCDLYGKVAKVQAGGNMFPDIAESNDSNAERYRPKSKQ